MKKIAFFLMTAAVAFACSKETPKGNNGGGNIDDEGNDPEFVGKINIDGQFADWAALGSDCSTATCPASALATALKTFKLTGDEMYVYVYAEFDKAQMAMDASSADGNHIDLYINSDNNVLTGGIYYLWDPLGYEYLIEQASFFKAGVFSDMSAVSYFKFTGEDGTDVWATDPPAREELSSANLCKANGAVEGDLVKLEFSIMRALIPGLGNVFTAGLCVQPPMWGQLGSLPVGEVVDGAQTYVAPLSYNLPAALE